MFTLVFLKANNFYGFLKICNCTVSKDFFMCINDLNQICVNLFYPPKNIKPNLTVTVVKQKMYKLLEKSLYSYGFFGVSQIKINIISC